MSDVEPGRCSYCNCKPEIIGVKFWLHRPPAMVWTCPNCALAKSEPTPTVLMAMFGAAPAIKI
jgi:hypothetical protein